jgi:gluconate 5-dehydrogenase
MSEPTVQQLFDLTGKVALITGGTGHLGSAMSRALAEAGASVVLCSRHADKARQCAAALPMVGRAKHHGVALDHMDITALERGFHEAIERAGQVDILVNNGHEALSETDWTDVTPEQFNRQLANATGYFHLARLVRNHAAGRKAPASVIMLGSMYGSVASYPDAYAGVVKASPVAYHCLKGGILHMTRHLAVYWASDRVRVNCLSPGPFPIEGKANAVMVERLCHKVPMKRMGRPDELKGIIVFLASDASSYMTGQNVLIDGGWTAW